MSEFWWRTHGLGAISPRKEEISAKFHILDLQNYKFQHHSPVSDKLYCVPRYALCYLLQEPEAGVLIVQTATFCF